MNGAAQTFLSLTCLAGLLGCSTGTGRGTDLGLVVDLSPSADLSDGIPIETARCTQDATRVRVAAPPHSLVALRFRI